MCLHCWLVLCWRTSRRNVSVGLCCFHRDAAKSGVEPSGCVVLAKHVKENCPNLTLAGLMTIGMPDFTSRPENFDVSCKHRTSALSDRFPIVAHSNLSCPTPKCRPLNSCPISGLSTLSCAQCLSGIFNVLPFLAFHFSTAESVEVIWNHKWCISTTDAPFVTKANRRHNIYVHVTAFA